MLKKFVYSLLSLLYLIANLEAQTNQSYKVPVYNDADRLAHIQKMLPLIDSLYKNYAKARNFPSLSYGVLLDGKIVYSGHVGSIQLDKNIPSDIHSMYRIASMSKSITAMAIMQLRDAGALHLDDPASKYLPYLKQDKLLTTDAPAITIRHLLTHGAGFPEDNPWGDRQLEDKNSDLVDLIQQGTYFSNVPGITFEYSNTGFALLGQIVEKVSGKTLEAYTKEKIFLPLGMTHTEWEYTKVPADKLAHGYRSTGGQWAEEPLLHHGSYGAMGGLITSIEDFSKYVAFHQSAWPPRSGPEHSVLRRSTLREMQMPGNFSGLNPNFKYASGRPCAVVSTYFCGLGWMMDCEGRVYIGHSGGLPGFGSQWRMLPEYGLGVNSFANLTYAGLGGINLQILDTLIRGAGLKPFAIPPSDILLQRKKEILDIIPDWTDTKVAKYGHGTTNIFAENFFPDYGLEQLRTSHRSMFDDIGQIKSIDEVVPENQLRGTFKIHGEQGSLLVFYTLSPENPPLIQELRLSKEE
jgi:CubicO group peptidase (beta-lactamase class C family)